MAEDHTPPAEPPAAETDPLRDMWLFILFAIGLLCFLFFAAPKGCSDALQGKQAGATKIAFQTETRLPGQR